MESDAEKIYCLTLTHYTALGYEGMIDRKVVAFMGSKQKVFRDALMELGETLPPSLDYMDIDYESRLKSWIENNDNGHYEYQISNYK